MTPSTEATLSKPSISPSDLTSAELPGDNALGRRLKGQRDEDPLQGLPLFDDQPRVDLAKGFEHEVLIPACVREAVERGPDLFVELPVPQLEPVVKDVKRAKFTSMAPDTWLPRR